MNNLESASQKNLTAPLMPFGLSALSRTSPMQPRHRLIESSMSQQQKIATAAAIAAADSPFALARREHHLSNAMHATTQSSMSQSQPATATTSMVTMQQQQQQQAANHHHALQLQQQPANAPAPPTVVQTDSQLKEYIESMIAYLTETVWKVVSWGLFVEHQLIFSFSLCINILKHETNSFASQVHKFATKT